MEDIKLTNGTFSINCSDGDFSIVTETSEFGPFCNSEIPKRRKRHAYHDSGKLDEYSFGNVLGKNYQSEVEL